MNEENFWTDELVAELFFDYTGLPDVRKRVEEFRKAKQEYKLHNTECLSLSEIEPFFLSHEHFRAVKEIARKKLNL